MSSLEAPIVVTSSSPLRTFARSQTPIDFSSPSNVNSSIQAIGIKPGQGTQQTTFKTAQVIRDGFSTSFIGARNVLTAKSGAENVPMQRSPPKFILTPPKASPLRFPKPYAGTPGAAIACKTQVESTEPFKPPTTTHKSSWDDIPEYHATVVRVLPSDARKKKKSNDDLSLQLSKAVARRKDWTPTKLNNATSGFGLDLVKAFGHSESSSFEKTSSDNGALTKRRKIDLTGDIPGLKPKPKLTAAKPRSKSPPKKSVTITGLATSHYDDKKEEPSPMAQYLVSTQDKIDRGAGPDTVQVKMRAKKSNAKKKSNLASPGTAQKNYEEQEVIFATSSQLARDESPTLLKDTIEAMRISEEDYESELMATQQTATFSRGTISPQKSRLVELVGRRRLWAAGERDEDGALLHVDDEFDLPDLKDAFAGKDAQVERAAAIASIDGPTDSLSLLHTLNEEAAAALADVADDREDQGAAWKREDTAAGEEAMTYDIDDVMTPTLIKQQTRKYSTSSRFASSKTNKTVHEKGDTDTARYMQQPTAAIASVSSSEKSPAKKKPPAKPNYTTWTDEQLKEEVKCLGFKRLRARKTMIDRLDEHYARQHGLDPTKVKAASKEANKKVETMQQVDMLGKAHDFADRPAPPKKRKPRKKREEVRSVVIAEDDIVDISDIENSGLNTWDRLAAIKVMSDSEDDEPHNMEIPVSTAPVKGTGVKATTKRKPPARMLTPPPTNPLELTQQSSPGFEDHQIDTERPQTASTPSSSSTDVDIKSQIRPALLKPPPDMATRNQVTNPTWYQKITMYDPIVLEDFTAWLNTEGFNNINEDREIDVQLVKEWCQENGVCCLWKGGWRGNTMKKKGEE